MVGAAEQEQRFGEVDRPGVDEVEAVDKFAGVAARIVAGHLEKCLRDRQWHAQFVGGVGRESLLFGDVCFDPRERGVEGIGQFAELVCAGPEDAEVTSPAANRIPAPVLSHWGVLQQELVGCLKDARIDASLVSNMAPRSRMVRSDR